MTPDEIGARWAALREAGAKLRRRPARDVLDSLARVLDDSRDPDSPLRRELEAVLPAATGFSPEVVREGLARGLDPWSGDALRELYERELGAPEESDARVGFDATAVVLAGSIPMPTLLALLTPLALRSPVLVKPASRDPVTARLFLRSLAETDPELAGCAGTLDLARDDDAGLEAFLRADCITATGSDETIAALKERVTPPRVFVGHGHALSVAAFLPPHTDGEALETAASGLALDISLWDQLGCLSPIALYVVSPEPVVVDRAAEALARELAALEARLPRGAIDAASAAAISHERAEAEMRAASGRRVALHASAGTEWSVVREDTAQLRPAPLHRFVRVHPVADDAEFLAALRPLARHLAGVALAAEARSGLAESLYELGATRICVPGGMQSPPIGWPRGGRGVFTPLVRA